MEYLGTEVVLEDHEGVPLANIWLMETFDEYPLLINWYDMVFIQVDVGEGLRLAVYREIVTYQATSDGARTPRLDTGLES